MWKPEQCYTYVKLATHDRYIPGNIPNKPH